MQLYLNYFLICTTGSAKERDRLRERQRATEIASNHVEEEEDGIRFINVPSESSVPKKGADPKEIRPIKYKDIVCVVWVYRFFSRAWYFISLDVCTESLRIMRF